MVTATANGHANVTHATAKRYTSGGISVIPTAQNKLPAGWKLPRDPDDDTKGTWKPYQERLPSDSELFQWFGDNPPRAGIACVHGKVSGNLETLDFDEDSDFIFPAWCELVEAQAPGLLEKLTQTRTPRPGIQIRYRCAEPVEGNQKLAEVIVSVDGKTEQKVRIETRGEGGYCVSVGTLPRFHPANRAYEHIAGPAPWEPEVITAAERQILFNAARAFDLLPYEPDQERKAGGSKYEMTPWDDFNSRSDWSTILTNHGWNLVHEKGGLQFWRHREASGEWSATLGYKGNGLLHVFSTNAGIPANKSYSMYAAVVHFDYRGDFRRAADEMLASGFGKLKPNRTGSNRAPEPPPPWGEPKRLPSGIPDVMAFDVNLLPHSFGDWAQDAADRTQAPIDYIGCASIVALSALAGRRIAIRPKRQDDWTVVPNLWGFAVGPPGVMKSQAIQEGFRPLTRLEIEAGLRHEQEMKEFAAREMIAAAKKAAAKKDVEKALRNGDPALANEIAEAAVNSEAKPPERRRYLSSDATVEKLGEILSVNPYGVAILRDEMPGLWKSLDREGQECSRAFYLEAWNGDGRFTYDRIGRGTVVIPNVCISIFGTVQPGPLGEFQRAATRNGCDADGLLQRFQLSTWPDVSREWVNVDRWPDTDAKSLAYSVFTTIDRMQPADMGAVRDEDDPDGIPYLRFSPEAQQVFDDWRGKLEHTVRDASEHPVLVAHLSKYRSLIPSLSLLIHLAEYDDYGAVGLRSLEKALAWATYLESHARRIFAASVGSDIQGAKMIAEKIIEGALADGFTVREVYQRCWSGLTTKDDVEDAIGLLIDLDWLQDRKESTGGAPKLRHYINPAIQRKHSPS